MRGSDKGRYSQSDLAWTARLIVDEHRRKDRCWHCPLTGPCGQWAWAQEYLAGLGHKGT